MAGKTTFFSGYFSLQETVGYISDRFLENALINTLVNSHENMDMNTKFGR